MSYTQTLMAVAAELDRLAVRVTAGEIAGVTGIGKDVLAIAEQLPPGPARDALDVFIADWHTWHRPDGNAAGSILLLAVADRLRKDAAASERKRGASCNCCGTSELRFRYWEMELSSGSERESRVLCQRCVDRVRGAVQALFHVA